MKKITFLTMVGLMCSAMMYGQSKTAAVKFDGVDDKIVVPNHSALNLGRSEFTIEAWIIADTGNIGSVSPMVIGKKGHAMPSMSGWLFGLKDDGKLALQIAGVSYYPGFGGPGGSGVSAKDLRDGQCHHIAWTRETDGVEDTVRGYQDGLYVRRTKLKAGQANMSDTANLWIAGSAFNTGPKIYQFSGSIKEIRIWNKAKSETEILADKNKHLVGNEPGLVAYWRMNENGGLVAFECVNGNDGNISGAVWDNTFCDNLSNNAPAKCDGIIPTGIVEAGQNAEILVYPNPVTNEINLTSPMKLKMDGVALYDMNGKTVLRTNWDGMSPLSVSNLQSGTYLLELTHQGAQVYKTMLTKE